ncbi:diacylglycerol kinase family protein [Actinoplanes sp. NPDC023714]|uniref:diacylglycerol kinase family protein n=1 Tax=Actinoplanes sp. NPDC023714 TaxID=3154322 RepID=UPI0033C82582
MYDVVLLSLAEGSGSADACGGGCGGGGCGSPAAEAAVCAPRTPVLACADALRKAGARVETVMAASDKEIDAVLARFDGPARPDGLTWPDPDTRLRLVVATATDGQLRAVVRRLVRRYAPPPSKRPADLDDVRTVPDLPPLAILPLDRGNKDDLAAQLGLPRTPEEVAAAVLTGPVRRLDLLRNDGGSVTLDGALLGGADDNGRAVPWRGRVEVDDALLTDGEEPVLACAVGNAGGYAEFDGFRLLADGDPTDGRVEVAVAVPIVVKQRFRGTKIRIEVRRARGRAVSVLPREGDLQFLDDGVAGSTSRKRSWWTEPGAWAVYAG